MATASACFAPSGTIGCSPTSRSAANGSSDPTLPALLWPAHRRELAQANLRKALHLARALPWARAVETQGNGVRFVIEL